MEKGQFVEQLSAAVHDRWLRTKRDQGVESRCSESGEELMVPYADLSEQAKDLDRGSVRAVLSAVTELGFALLPLAELADVVDVALVAVNGAVPTAAAET